MIWHAVDLIEARKSSVPGFAFGMDIRDTSFSRDFPVLKKKLMGRLRLDVVFFTAEDTVLAKRFGETRRRHPLLARGGDLRAAITRERKLLQPVQDAADIVFDSSNWSPHTLARNVEARYQKDIPARQLYVTISSFGFKYGQPRPLESIFDVRFVNNPHFVPELRPKTGIDRDVRDHIFADPSAGEFLARIEDMMRFALPKYYQEGKHFFRIGMGCTGGRHRSVAFAEELGRRLTASAIPNVVVRVEHRDIDHAEPAAEDE